MQINLEVSELNEGTRSPWWLIIDPRQNFQTNNDGIYNIADMITAPFFSREEAEMYLETRRYNYSKNAAVYCHSGCHTIQYDRKMNERKPECIAIK